MKLKILLQGTNTSQQCIQIGTQVKLIKKTISIDKVSDYILLYTKIQDFSR